MLSYIPSCIVYYIVFMIAGFFFNAADKTYNNHLIRKRIIIGIIFLCIFAGVRSISVGTDTATLIRNRFENLNNYYSSWKAILTPGNEPFITLIGYFIKNTVGDYRFFLFVLQLLFEIPIGVVAYKLREDISIADFFSVFMLMFFQYSLNIHKQSIAAAWLLLAAFLFKEKKFIPAILLTIFASLFHGSVFMGVALLLFAYFLSNSKSRNSSILIITIAMIVAIIVILNWRTIASYILGSSGLSNDYTVYISTAAGETGARYTAFHYKTYISIVLRSVGILLIGYFYLKSADQIKAESRFYMYAVFIGFIIYSVIIIMFHMYIGDRLTYYVDICQIVLLPKLIGKEDVMKCAKRNAFTIRSPFSGPSICLVFYFIYNFTYFMFVNYGKTLPYCF